MFFSPSIEITSGINGSLFSSRNEINSFVNNEKAFLLSKASDYAEITYSDAASKSKYSFFKNSEGSIAFSEDSDGKTLIDFSILTVVPIKSAGFGNGVRGVFAGGYTTPSDFTITTIQYVNIATTGNSIVAAGELNATEGAKSDSSVADSTRGCVAGLDIDTGTPSQTNAIHFITTATLGDSQDFGDLTVARRCGNGVSSSTTRGLFYSGSPGPGPHRNTIDYITIQSLGNAIDFGDITTHNNQDGASHGSNLTRSVNRVNNDANTIEYVTIATLGNTIEFGDSTHVAASNLGIDNSNGSIG